MLSLIQAYCLAYPPPPQLLICEVQKLLEALLLMTMSESIRYVFLNTVYKGKYLVSTYMKL